MTVTLPAEPAKPVIDLSKQTILLYGPPKFGKCLSGRTVIHDPHTGRVRRLDEVVRRRAGRVLTLCPGGRLKGVQPSAFLAHDPLLKWDLVVVSGSCAGRHIFKNSVIRPTTLSFVKGDLECIGLRLTKFSDLAELLPGALDKTVEVRKKTRGEFTDVYFERLITLPAGVAPPPRQSASDIPF